MRDDEKTRQFTPPARLLKGDTDFVTTYTRVLTEREVWENYWWFEDQRYPLTGWSRRLRTMRRWWAWHIRRRWRKFRATVGSWLPSSRA